MNKSVLIMGGARFHGFLLAKKLSASGMKVYVLNRGRFRPEPTPGIRHLAADRDCIEALEIVLSGLKFDVIIDNNAYRADQVVKLLKAVKGRFIHYIFTSTAAVYMSLTSKEKFKEAKADGSMSRLFAPEVIPYAENKLDAERYITDRLAKENYTIVRLPNIFGEDDFSKKLHYFTYRIVQGKKFVLEKEIGKFSVVYVRDVVNLFYHILLKEKFFGKIINFADPVPYDYHQFFKSVYEGWFYAENIVLTTASKIRDAGYALPFAWGPQIDTTLFESLTRNFVFTPLQVWGKRVLSHELEACTVNALNPDFFKARKEEQKLMVQHQ